MSDFREQEPPAGESPDQDLREALREKLGRASAEEEAEVINLDAARRERKEQPKPRLPGWVAAMNERYCVTLWGKSGVIADLKSAQNGAIRMLPVRDWKLTLSNEFVQVGKNLVPKSEAWLQHAKRHQRLHPGVVFEPGAPEQPGALNLGRGFAVEPKAGDWSLMQAHIRDILCNGNQEHYEYVLNWLAFNVQFPAKPAQTVLIFKGAQGAGKGVVLTTFGSFFGPHFLHYNDPEQILGKHNADLGMGCFGFLDEAFWGGDRRGADKLKAIITEPTLVIEPKFLDRMQVPNRLSIAVASNKEWAMPVEVGDRRYAVFQVNERYAHKAENPDIGAYFKALWAEVDNGGREAMLYDLLHRDLSGFDIRAIPKSKAKTEMMIRGLTGQDGFVSKWLYQILSDGQIEIGPDGDLLEEDPSRLGTVIWGEDGLMVSKEALYVHYCEACKAQSERPLIKELWAKTVSKILADAVNLNYRSRTLGREQHVRFCSLDMCRERWSKYTGTSGDGSVWES
jgi:Family of unknown function (DUF5906)